MGKVVCFYKRSKEGRIMSKNKAENLFRLLKMIVYFANNSSQKLYKTKLNKLLFYTQFAHKKLFGKPLLEFNFIKDYYGPVLEELDKHLSLFKKLNFISSKYTCYGEVIESNIEIPESEYANGEKEIMRLVLNRFDSYTSKEISDYSHNESLWLTTDLKDIIDIERANELNEF